MLLLNGRIEKTSFSMEYLKANEKKFYTGMNIDNQICVIWVCIEIIKKLFIIGRKKQFFSGGVS